MNQSDTERAQREAIDEFHRQESLALCRAYPEWLATIRAHDARANAFLASRGLPPLPERYPELDDPRPASS